MIGFTIGLFVGLTIGIVVISLLTVAKISDLEERNDFLRREIRRMSEKTRD